ncbi:MAG: winged helix-turn-helix domain-containing protein [Bryobacteraceae bacterium]|nr:winged helix-turn-helix domain-containing protein [Bryobacteraceae bacterium]
MAEVELRLLGRFDLVVQGSPVDESRWGRKKAKTLLKLLALTPNRTLHREQVLEWLWPESEPEAALNNLHKLLHAARRVLEPDLKPGAASRYLHTVESMIELAGEPLVTVDLDRFDELGTIALRDGDRTALEAALALYTGDLLEEDRYEDWCSVRREQARQLAERLLESLARAEEFAGEPHRAEATLRRLLTMNRAHEEAHRQLMRLYGSLGQRQRAREQYRVCREALRAELDAEPELATQRLYESLMASEGPEVLRPPAPALATQRRWWRLALLLALAPLTLVAVAWWWNRAKATPLRGVNSLAILPFRAGTQDGGVPAIAEGLTEGLINSSSRLRTVRVMARSTVFVYQGRTDAVAVGRELKVSAVLFGRVRAEGNAYRVAMELVDTGDGSRLWGREYSAPTGDLSRMQQTLNAELLAQLGGPATPAVRQTQDPEAFRLYLSGRYFANQRSEEGLRKSIGYYEQAIRRDPAYALAFAGLADSYGLSAVRLGHPSDYFPRARAAALRAIELDETLAEAHTSLAMVRALYEWDFPGAEAEFGRAIQLNDGYATAHHWFGVHLGAMGRFGEADRQLARARELDPLSPIILLNSGYPAYYQRQFPAALAWADRALELKPDFTVALEDRVEILDQMGKTAEAAKAAEAYLRAIGEAKQAQGFQKDYHVARRAWFAALRNKGTAMELASMAARSGDVEAGLHWLEEACERREGMIVYIGVDPVYEPLRSQPRFQKVLARVGLAKKD